MESLQRCKFCLFSMHVLGMIFRVSYQARICSTVASYLTDTAGALSASFITVVELIHSFRCVLFSVGPHMVAMYLGFTHRNRSAIPLLRTYLHAVSSASCIVRVFYTMCTFFSTSARNIPAAHDRSSRITKIGVFFLPHAATVKSDSTFRLTTKLVWGCEQPRV